MIPHTLIGVALGTWLGAAVIYHVAAQIALRRHLSRSPDLPSGPLPSATILTPVGSGAPGLEENLSRLCSSGAPVLAGAEHPRGEGAAAARRVLAREGPGRLTLITGAARRGANRKIATLAKMTPVARGEILVFADADVRVSDGYLDAVLAPFADPGVGMVTCPYRSVGGRSAASRTDALITNANFLPSVTLAARLEGVRFALGCTLAVRRSLLEKLGGLEPLLDQLADDWALADGVLRAGHRIVLSPLLLDHHVGEPRWGTLWLRHLRWARTMRAVRPAGYAGTFCTYGLAPAAGLALLAGGAAGAAPLLAWAIARGGTVGLNARRTGVTALDLVLLPLADLLSLALFVTSFLGRTVRWGDSRLRVGQGGFIQPAAGEPATAPLR